MSRKANRSIPFSWILVLVGFVLLAGVGIYLLRSVLADPYHGVPELPLTEYIDNSLSLRGNTYQLTGKVENELGWSETSGRFFSFESDSSSQPFHVAILLPSRLSQVNVQKGQSFKVKLKVVDKGLLQAMEIRKS